MRTHKQHLGTISFLLVLNELVIINGSFFRNKYTDYVDDPVNYYLDASCKGIKFPNDLAGTIAFKAMVRNVQEIILPDYGIIVLEDGGGFEFDESTEVKSMKEDANNKTCTNVKVRNTWPWIDASTWIYDYTNNTSVPDVERIPCDHDLVVLDGVYNNPLPESDVVLQNLLAVRGLHMAVNRLLTEVGSMKRLYFMGKAIGLLLASCGKKSGCVCHERTEQLAEEVCDYIAEKSTPDSFTCIDPIQPIGFCRRICGGYIQMIVDDGFDLKRFRKQIPHYERTNVYASKVQLNATTRVVQTVFTDKLTNYEAYSVRDVERFKNDLVRDLQSYSIKSLVAVSVSGLPYYPEQSLTTGFAIVLITLLTTVVAFATIFYVYHYRGESKTSIGGLRFLRAWTQQRPVVSQTFAFARFENREDEDDADVSGVSLTGGASSSCGDRERSFDNPLYGVGATSDSSTPSTSKMQVDDDDGECGTELAEIGVDSKGSEMESVVSDESDEEE